MFVHMMGFFTRSDFKKELTKCVKESKQKKEIMLHINEDLQQGDAVPMPVPVMGNAAPDEKKQVFFILSFLGLHLMTSCPAFGLFTSVWLMLHSYFNQTAPELIWKWTKTHLSRVSVNTPLVLLVL